MMVRRRVTVPAGDSEFSAVKFNRVRVTGEPERRKIAAGPGPGLNHESSLAGSDSVPPPPGPTRASRRTGARPGWPGPDSRDSVVAPIMMPNLNCGRGQHPTGIQVGSTTMTDLAAATLTHRGSPAECGPTEIHPINPS